MRGDEFPMTIDTCGSTPTLARNLPGLGSAQYLRGYELVRAATRARWRLRASCSLELSTNDGSVEGGPALATGNTVVLKPADTTPVTAVMMAEIAGRYLPAGVLNVVVGDRDTGRSLVAHPRPDLISGDGKRTGGERDLGFGCSVLEAGASGVGRKSTGLVFDDADIDAAVKWHCLRRVFQCWPGLRCSNRVLVQESIYDEFVEKLVRCAEENRTGHRKRTSGSGRSQ